MKIKIDEQGILCIERKGKWIKTNCKYKEGFHCTHRCSHFEEPFKDTECDDCTVDPDYKDCDECDADERDVIIHLELCDNKYYKIDKEDFTDERK